MHVPAATVTCVTTGPDLHNGHGWSPRVVDVVGRFASASNTTLLAETSEGERVIYKPIAGEAPLWDFRPETLAAREVLTYRVSEAMKLGVVPETVVGSGPFGLGAVQRFVESEPGFDPLVLVRSADARLWPIAVLDIVCNNADRKVGHLLGGGDAVLGIDHGLTFHPDDKLRTVLWVFAGERLPEALVGALRELSAALRGDLGAEFKQRLGPAERRALVGRVEALLDDPRHPEPPTDRPPVPWPPY